MTLAQRIRTARRARGMSQQTLAYQARMSLRALSSLESGEAVDPHFSTLRGIADALGVTVAELTEEPVAPLGEAPQDSGRPDQERRELFHYWRLSTEQRLEWWNAEIAEEENRMQPPRAGWTDGFKLRVKGHAAELEDAGVLEELAQYMNAVTYGEQYVDGKTAREAQGLYKAISELRQVLRRALAVSREAPAERQSNNESDITYIEDKMRQKQKELRRVS